MKIFFLLIFFASAVHAAEPNLNGRNLYEVIGAAPTDLDREIRFRAEIARYRMDARGATFPDARLVEKAINALSADNRLYYDAYLSFPGPRLAERGGRGDTRHFAPEEFVYLDDTSAEFLSLKPKSFLEWYDRVTTHLLGKDGGWSQAHLRNWVEAYLMALKYRADYHFVLAQTFAITTAAPTVSSGYMSDFLDHLMYAERLRHPSDGRNGIYRFLASMPAAMKYARGSRYPQTSNLQSSANSLAGRFTDLLAAIPSPQSAAAVEWFLEAMRNEEEFVPSSIVVGKAERALTALTQSPAHCSGAIVPPPPTLTPEVEETIRIYFYGERRLGTIRRQ